MPKTDVTETNETQAPVKVEARIAQYIECRDAIAKAKEEYEKSVAPLVTLQNMLTGWLQRFMDTTGSTSVKSKFGTCYSSTKYTASLADPKAFMDYVISTKQFDLLDRKANVTAVKDHVADKGALPPGVNLSAIETVGVRRPAAKPV